MFLLSCDTTIYGGAADAYAIAGDSPELVADFPADYFRLAGVVSDFDTLFTYTGASLSTTVDSSGNIVWKPHNTSKHSEGFNESSWAALNINITANDTAAPDGNTTADKAQATATNAKATQTLTIASGKNKLGVFGKEGSVKYLRFQTRNFDSGANDTSYFDLNAGTVNQEGTNHTATISSAANGFYLCTIEITSVTDLAGEYAIGVSNTGTDTTAASGNNIYLWGAHAYSTSLGGMQDNPSDFPTYTPTTTAAVYGPRRHHHIYNGSSWVDKGVEIESEARTNLVTYSSEIDDAAWSKVNSSITSDTAAGPDGNTLADKLVENSSTASHYVYYTASGVTVADSTVSCWFKDAGDSRWGILRSTANGANDWIVINLSTGAITETGSAVTGSSVEDWGGGWYRAVMTFPAADSTTGIELGLSNSATPGSGRPSYAGDGSSGVYVWGAQYEDNVSTASTYIPTSGGTATRTAETLTIAGADTPANTTAMSQHIKGTINYADENAAAQQVFTRRYVGANDYITIDLDTDSGTGEINFNQAETGSGADTVASGVSVLTPGPAEAFNIAMRNVSTALNGALDGTSFTENATPTALDDFTGTTLEIGYDFMGTIDTIREFGKDIADSGIETAST